MRCPASSTAPKIVAAKAGVPRKTRSRGRLGPVMLILAPFSGSGGSRWRPASLGLGKLAQNHTAFQRRNMVDKEDAVEVIDLMLQAHSQQPRGLHLADLVLVVEIAHADRCRAGDLGVMFG